MLYLGVEGRFEQPHHSIHIAKDYVRNLDEIENQHVLSADPSFYVQNASVTDPSLAPPGCGAFYVLSPVPHLGNAPLDWASIGQGYGDRILEALSGRQAAERGVGGEVLAFVW